MHAGPEVFANVFVNPSVAAKLKLGFRLSSRLCSEPWLLLKVYAECSEA